MPTANEWNPVILIAYNEEANTQPEHGTYQEGKRRVNDYCKWHILHFQEEDPEGDSLYMERQDCTISHSLFKDWLTTFLKWENLSHSA